MTIPINDIIKYDGDDWDSYLTQICLADVFGGLYEEFGEERDLMTGIVRYIIWAYSIDSNKIVLRGEWVQNKKKIFKLAEIPPTLEQDIIYLKNKVVLKTIKKWLNYQGQENYTTWTMLNDLIMEMRIAANLPILKSTGEIDYKTKMDCAGYVIELQAKKDEVEQKFIQNNEKLKEAYKDVSQANNTQQSNTMGIETILKERKN